jgi:hypothetical protein
MRRADDLPVLKDGEVELDSFFGVAIEPKEWRNLLHAASSVRALNHATSSRVAAAITGLTITGTILCARDEAGKDGALRQ